MATGKALNGDKGFWKTKEKRKMNVKHGTFIGIATLTLAASAFAFLH